MVKTSEKLERLTGCSAARSIAVATLLVLAMTTLPTRQTAVAQTKRPSKPQPAAQGNEPKQEAGGDKVGVLVGEIKDRERGAMFAGLEVELKLMGAVMVDAKASGAGRCGGEGTGGTSRREDEKPDSKRLICPVRPRQPRKSS